MALMTYAAMVKDVAPYLPGCPQITIERALKEIIIDLCERARVWKGFATDVPLVVGDYDYALAASNANARVLAPLAAKVQVGTKYTDLTFVQYLTLRAKRPSWPVDDPGIPQYFTSAEYGSILLAPVPDESATMTDIWCDLAPLEAATGWEDSLYYAHRKVVEHGVLHRLMAMKEQRWTDLEGSKYHGRQWTHNLNRAKIAASRDFIGDSEMTQMSPFA